MQRLLVSKSTSIFVRLQSVVHVGNHFLVGGAGETAKEYPRSGKLIHGSHIFGLKNFPDFSSILSVYDLI